MRRCSLFVVLLSFACLTDPADGGETGESSSGTTTSGTTQPMAESTQGTSSSSSTGPGDTSASSATTLADGSTTAVEASCGDGNTDEDEDCDDGNRVDSDGCNNDCYESGSVLWVEALPNTPGTSTDTLNAVIVLEDGAILAGGSRFIGRPKALHGEANLVRFSPDGMLDVDVDLVTTERDDSVRGLELDSEGRLYAVGDQDAAEGVQSPALVPGVTDDSVGSDPVETVSFLRDVVMDEHGVYVAGYRLDGTTLRAFTTTSPVTEVAYVPDDPENNSYIWGVAIAEPGNPSSVLWSVGWNDGTDLPLLAQLYRVGRDGDLEDTLPSYSGVESEGAFYTSIIIGPAGDLIVAGGSLIGDLPNLFEPLVRRLDPAGEERWTRVFNEVDSTRGGITALAQAEDGTIAVCGNATDIAGGRRRLVAKLRP